MAGRKLMHSEQWWATQKPEHVLRCTARLKNDGSQCRFQAWQGTNVCGTHGAKIPSVQASAARRIQMSVDDAVKRLHQMLDDGGVDARDKIKILHDLLDRGGLGATSKVLVGVVTEDPIEKLFAAILMDPSGLVDPNVVPKQITRDAAQEALNRLADMQDQDPDDIVDAEIVDPARTPAEADIAARPPDRNSTVPPRHIRDDLERLGLL